MPNMKPLLLLGYFTARVLAAQGAPNEPAFEVATVKPAADNGPTLPPLLRGIVKIPDSAEAQRIKGGPGTADPERIEATGVTLKALISRAYGLQPYQITGPDWIGELRYDLVAKLTPGATADEARGMLRQLLAERFQLRVHTERQSLKVFELKQAKGGHKLTPPQPAADADSNNPATRLARASEMMQQMQEKMKARAAAGAPVGGAFRSMRERQTTIAEFAGKITADAGRPVLDRTQLDGQYSLALEWTPAGNFAQDVGDAPPLAEALEQQLGLKLEPATALMDVLIVDGVEKTPTAD
jgi:uncharacterized protein (TIGR03435 family)